MSTLIDTEMCSRTFNSTYDNLELKQRRGLIRKVASTKTKITTALCISHIT